MRDYDCRTCESEMHNCWEEDSIYMVSTSDNDLTKVQTQMNTVMSSQPHAHPASRGDVGDPAAAAPPLCARDSARSGTSPRPPRTPPPPPPPLRAPLPGCAASIHEPSSSSSTDPSSTTSSSTRASRPPPRSREYRPPWACGCGCGCRARPGERTPPAWSLLRLRSGERGCDGGRGAALRRCCCCGGDDCRGRDEADCKDAVL